MPSRPPVSVSRSKSPSLVASPTGSTSGAAASGGDIVVSSTMAEAVAHKLLPEFQDKVRPMFEFYCRIGDPSNDGQMSQANFIRLMQDCDAIDEWVTISLIDVQLAITMQRRRRAHGLSTSEDHQRVPRLDMKLFLEALVRVSQLIFIARGTSAVSSPLDHAVSPGANGIASDVQNTPAFAEATRFARLFLVNRILPLSVLTVAEEETVAMLQQPDVALCLSAPANDRFLKVRAAIPHETW